jgi:hypothetical protein
VGEAGGWCQVMLVVHVVGGTGEAARIRPCPTHRAPLCENSGGPERGATLRPVFLNAKPHTLVPAFTRDSRYFFRYAARSLSHSGPCSCADTESHTCWW